MIRHVAIGLTFESTKNQSFRMPATMNEPRAMLVDLDDTLIGSERSTETCWRLACEESVDRISSISADRLLREIRRTYAWYWSDQDRHRMGRANLTRTTISVVDQSLHRLGFDLPELAIEIGRSYRSLRDEKIELLPGAIDALQRFRKQGVRLALITNGTGAGQRAKIERFNLERRFDHILIEGELGVGKPEREFYIAAMDALECCPSETWCVGDNLLWEVEAPQAMGIYSVWVDRFGVGLPAGSHVKPNRIVTSIAELRI